MKHQAWCQEALDRNVAERAKWSQMHPGHCRTCEGRAVVGTGDMDRDTGIIDLEPCPDCVSEDRCPWCGRELVEQWPDDATGRVMVCLNPDCQWRDSLDEGHGMPHLAECDCWMEPEPLPDPTLDALNAELARRSAL